MDATIAAAWIGAGIGGGVALIGLAGTVASSIVNSVNTRRATEATVGAGTEANRATLLAAREDALWSRRAAAYEETLASLLHRQAKRSYDLRDYELPADIEKQMDDYYKAHEPPGVFDAEGRLAAYASDPVRAAFELTRGAHAAVVIAQSHRDALRRSKELAFEKKLPEGVPEPHIMQDAEDKLESARKDATLRDGTLIDTIREELRSRPEAVTSPPALPAVRRGLWHRVKP